MMFTKNPLERFMIQPPRHEKEEPVRAPAPRGHFCYGCGRYGLNCMRPCYRDWQRPNPPAQEK